MKKLLAWTRFLNLSQDVVSKVPGNAVVCVGNASRQPDNKGMSMRAAAPADGGDLLHGGTYWCTDHLAYKQKHCCAI